MSIRPLPPVPTRDDPANFALKGDAFLAALPAFREDANALEQSLQLVATTGTSTTSLTVGTGSKTLTTDPGKAWATGAWVYVFASAAVSNYMVGRVTSYNATTGALVVNVSAIDGSGTHSAWVIGLATPAADGHLVARDGSRAMAGALTLPGNAANALEAVPKQQLDAAVAAIAGRSRVINGDFSVRQDTTYASGAAVPAGGYVFDGWKAGASGCTLTWAPAGNGFTVTITAGSLLQIIEPAAIEGGTYTLSHAGTAQMRINAGSYAAGPITVTGLPANTALTCEFSTGTVALVQLEASATASKFERLHPATVRAMCERYYSSGRVYCEGFVDAAGRTFGAIGPLKTTMRTAPTVSLNGIAYNGAGGLVVSSVSATDFFARAASTAPGSVSFNATFVADARL